MEQPHCIACLKEHICLPHFIEGDSKTQLTELPSYSTANHLIMKTHRLTLSDNALQIDLTLLETLD